MKNTLLTISLVILIITVVKSQGKIQFGIKGGINLTNMTSDFIIDKESQTGFHIGVLAEIPFRNKFSLQSEILYSTYGSKGEIIIIENSQLPIEYNFDYIQIPILLKVYLIKNLSLEIGPSLNFSINSEEIVNSITTKDIGENFEFSGLLGFSYKTNSGFLGSLRYTNGFTSAIQLDPRNDKNYGFLIGIGYLF